ncbi:MAG: SEL1-like repeat protein [Elusimicrobia bacterium]|nr:SEL1-like repeat protein [Elusimicrobiota bacterium]
MSSQYQLAILYAKGQGLLKNSQETARWLIKAAQSGIPRPNGG